MNLPVPSNRQKAAYRLNQSTGTNGLQGSNTPGSPTAAVTAGQTYSQVVSVCGSARVRVRILCGGLGAGTLNIKPVAPQPLTSGDESVVTADGTITVSKVRAYTTGTATVAVAAATEVKLDLDLYGENYVLVEFVCSATGTLVFCDVSQV